MLGSLTVKGSVWLWSGLILEQVRMLQELMIVSRFRVNCLSFIDFSWFDKNSVRRGICVISFKGLQPTGFSSLLPNLCSSKAPKENY